MVPGASISLAKEMVHERGTGITSIEITAETPIVTKTTEKLAMRMTRIARIARIGRMR
jgi:hypothetical protein